MGGNTKQAAGGRPEAAGEAFWRFSLALYARPGVARALLDLQDRAGRDVNLILFGLWAGACHGRVLESTELAGAVVATADLNGIVAELRAMCRRLAASPDRDIQELRRRLLRQELAAERKVQRRLAASLADPPTASPAQARRAAAEANLALHLADEADSPEAELLRRAVAALMRL